MTWGVFDGNPRVVHVAPCDDDGFALEPHVLSVDCPCHPAIENAVVEGFGPRTIIHHEQIQ